MNTPAGPSSEQHSESAASSPSVERRREALRRIGRAGAAAGAVTPMAALATGSSGKKWCYDKYKTKKVHASVSGMNSIVMSAAPENENFGKPCSHYGNSANLPYGCSNNGKFRDYFSCAEGSKDSNGVVYYYSRDNGCLFHKSITTLCGSHGSSSEAGWMTAYCNAAALNAMGRFPYSTTQVKGFWATGDLTMRASAHTFFRNYMEHG